MENLKTRGIIDHLGSCFPGSSGNYSDVILICCNGKVSAHKLVLASISQILYSEFKENIWDEIVYISLPDILTSEVTDYFLCAYNGKSLNEYSTLNHLIGCLYQEEDVPIPDEPVEIKEEKIEIVDVNSILDFNNYEDDIKTQNEDKVDAKPILIPLKVSKQKELKSKIWEHFEEVSDQNSEKVFACHHCSIKFQKTEAKISCMRRHLEDIHQIVINSERRPYKRKNKINNESSIDPISGEIINPHQKYSNVQLFILNHFVKVLDTDEENKIKFTCQHCQAQFWAKNLMGLYAEPLKEHLLTVHSIEYLLDEKIVINRSKSTIDPNTGELKEVKIKDYERKGVIWRYFKDHPDNGTLNKRKKFVCQICGKSFCHASLQRHTLNHNVVENEPASCTICGKTFKNFVRRDKHQRRHKEAKNNICQVCAKAFKTTQQLARHMMIHTGDKPHQCNECGRQFRQLTQLNTHMRIHTGEEPYECNICYKKFKFAASKRSHKCYPS